MQAPRIPENEPERLAALCRLDVLDTPPENRFDRITRLAQRLCDAPIALVSLVDAERQWFKSRQGLDATETPRDISFCGHALLDEKVFVVSNALEDPRFADNPLVAGPPGIRFYAGAPLHAPGGERVGTLCIIDRKPRELSETGMATLRDLADCVEAEFERTRLLETARRERHLTTVVERTTHGVAIADELGRLQWVNKGFEDITGYALSEVLGRKPGSFLQGPETDAATVAFMRERLREGTAFEVEVQNHRKDGRLYWISLSAQPVRGEDDRITNWIAIQNDITKRKDAEARLHASTAIRQAILDSANVSIISTDPEGIIQTFNRAAERILGYSAAEMLGQRSPAEFHDPEEVARRAKELALELGHPVAPGFEVFVAKARLGQPEEREWTYVRRDGSRVPVILSVTALRDAYSEISGFLGIAVDLTERKRVEQMKNEFISTVSHELRTPLTSIRGALNLILGKTGGSLPEKVRKLLDIAERNSERLTILINDILDLEKIEGGWLEFNVAPLDLAHLATRAVEDSEGFARKHDVRLELELRTGVARVLGDEHRLLQVFANLISNAVKYSPAGDTVKITLDREDGWIRIGVQDHGSGIPEHFRDRIFQRFAQADSSDSREKGGTGLGLSITKAIVERHAGHVGYETVVGRGTLFHFSLPALDGNAWDAEEPAAKGGLT